jgi:hypothetical protein
VYLTHSHHQQNKSLEWWDLWSLVLPGSEKITWHHFRMKARKSLPTCILQTHAKHILVVSQKAKLSTTVIMLLDFIEKIWNLLQPPSSRRGPKPYTFQQYTNLWLTNQVYWSFIWGRILGFEIRLLILAILDKDKMENKSNQ